jgi:hypothetical protein
VPDTAENRQFFVEFKELLKQRFQQIDIWMTTYPLDVILAGQSIRQSRDQF